MPGTWVGRGAERLRLDGAPGRGDLETLLSGQSPKTGENLRGGRGRPTTNAGFDLTFTAPKSMSVLLAVGDERVQAAVLKAHAVGVRAGLDYLERHECFARRGTDGVNVIPADGFAGAAYTHEMARSGDPHLHTHVVITNAVHASDGRWTAPDMRPVYAAAKTAGTIAEAAARDDLARSLGLRWRPVHNGTAEIDGVPQAVLEHFSRRHNEIAELALARGWMTERGIAEIQRETRDRKPQIDRDEAQQQWRARAAEHGFGESDLDAVMDKARASAVPGFVLNLRKTLAGPSGLTRQESTFTRRAVIQAVAGAYPQGIAPADIERIADDIIERDGVVVTERAGHEPARFTTLDMLATEQQLLDTCTARVRTAPTATSKSIETAIRASKKLGADQANAVRHLATGNVRTRLLEARAGYGKTTALRVLRDAYDRDGVTVIGTSWQGQAAQNMQREAGITSSTTARILSQLARGHQPIPDGAVVVVDEAGMMPTRALAELAAEVKRRKGRLILVGDRDQLPSIDAGGAFGSLVDRLGSAALEENRRQRSPLQRQIATHLADGKAADALALLAERGRLNTYDDVQQARRDLIDAWAKTSLQHPDRVLILAHDRRDVAALNELARARLDAAGKLGKRRTTAYGREWATGDRVLCRSNDYRKDVDLRNGTRGTVVKIDPLGRITIRTDDGRVVLLPPEYLQHVEHGYASTGHVSQGATFDRTYLLATPARGGREWAYVAGSRHRIDLNVYVIHHDRATAQTELQKMWERSQAKTLAIDRISAKHSREPDTADLTAAVPTTPRAAAPRPSRDISATERQDRDSETARERTRRQSRARERKRDRSRKRDDQDRSR